MHVWQGKDLFSLYWLYNYQMEEMLKVMSKVISSALLPWICRSLYWLHILHSFYMHATRTYAIYIKLYVSYNVGQGGT